MSIQGTNGIQANLRSLLQSPLATKMRNFTGIRPLAFAEPSLHCGITSQHVISDLFVWRADDHWQSYFDLVNLYSLAFPLEQSDETVELVIYDASGSIRARKAYHLVPFESRLINISEVTRDFGDFGSFAVFHRPERSESLSQVDCCLVERGYQSFRYSDEGQNSGTNLRTYVHGGNFVLGSRIASKEIIPARLEGRAKFRYTPQVDLGDCDWFELIFNNQLARTETINICLSGINWEESKEVELQAYGAFVLDSRNFRNGIVKASAISRMSIYRPLIIRHHGQHVDICHA